ncbi:MED6 mediator subfamily complex component-domain-containing protein [Sparassis latifolia]|uniref:Mediator of RNA polymerase II transcription subunit 6 n=1 Tax=Sparassis crispa TaxID=139825 RepID=A0A401G7C6_9APHY|nr:Mediator of RNA polymerase II transcription subunit 6 [Sparassis crispa]GBE78049.1 Mediator of RNA polymerase II transcription subunit 6 [Sparassis crispa]
MSDINDLHPPDDYSHRFFIWHEWIQANGPLTNENVFDYFATSMFYDKQSNNQVLRMQTMHTGVPLANEAEELKRFTGVEFAVVHAQPPSLFIIHKRERLSPEEVRPLAAYFIMHNRIYQSPDVYSLVSNRLLTSLHALQNSMNTLRAYKPDYTPRTGFSWPIVESSTSTSVKEHGSDEEAATSTDVEDLPVHSSQKQDTQPERQQNNMLLINAMRTTALHANVTFTLPAAVSESTVTETPALGTGARSSATPAPAPTRGATPKRVPDAPTPPENQPVKGPPGGGKKKRKRTSIAPPPIA